MDEHTVGTQPGVRRRRWLIWVAAALVVLAGAVLFYLRKAEGGIRNVFSGEHWALKASGKDFYNPDNHLLSKGNPNYKEVCFTFDDGPHPASCRSILSTLRANGIHATFFLVGIKIKEHPELARAIIDDGNEVGNHTMHHPRLDGLKFDQIHREMQECETTFEQATGGSHMYLFRPPGMRKDADVMNNAIEMGYVVVGWNIGAKDYTGSGVDSELVEKYVVEHLKPGGIILLHDNPITAAVLPDILKKVKEAGYSTVTVSELMRHLPNPVNINTNARHG